MSIAAMNWVWQLRLKPSVKFVLMALADAADDNGYCWPSIPTLAFKTCLDDRSVQRILSRLKAEELVHVQKRFRHDGSPTSNGYRLSLKISDGNLSPVAPAQGQEVVARTSPPGGTDVTQTTTEHINESKLLQPICKPTGSGCGGLIFPKQLSTKEVSLAMQKLGTFSTELAQELLDELAARLNACAVRGSPLGYLRSLIARAEAGTFSPEAGIRVGVARQRDKELAELTRENAPQNVPRPPSNPREQIEFLRKVLKSKTKFNQKG